MRATLGASALLLALAAGYWLAADAIPESSLGGAVGADGLPKLLAVVLAVLSIGLAAQVLLEQRKRRLAGAASGGSAPGGLGGHLRALGVIVIGAGFVVLLPVLGYAVSVALLLMTVATYSGLKPGLATVLFGVAGAAVFYLLFVRLLQVPLPAGVWPTLLSGAA